MPQSTAILTLGCAKFRLLGQDYGTVPGTELPRLMDMGQCNDAYGAVRFVTGPMLGPDGPRQGVLICAFILCRSKSRWLWLRQPVSRGA